MRNTVSDEKPVTEKKMLKPAAAKKTSLKKNAGNKTAVQPGAAEMRSGQVHSADVLIIGAGFAGLGTAIRLQQAGVKNIVILERSTDVGGALQDHFSLLQKKEKLLKKNLETSQLKLQKQSKPLMEQT